jgi:mRNA-degrading endonuclease toxin of MazEF toxin-antitoxin module
MEDGAALPTLREAPRFFQTAPHASAQSAACHLATYQEVVLNADDGTKSPCAVNLHHAVTLSQPRLGKRVAQLSSARMNEVCAALRFSLGCDAN